MGENSEISWTDHTFNPWIGCQKISPACDHCYAEAWDNRWGGGGHWGAHAPRRWSSDANWRQPLRWNDAALKAGTPARVFCCSLADVFDKRAPKGARDRLWQLIRDTPFLEWQLLTKRIGNVPAMLPADWADGYPNVGLMITVVNQDEADRDVPKLLEIAAKWRGLSCEPLLGPIDLAGFIPRPADAPWYPIECRHGYDGCPVCDRKRAPHEAIQWVITGGESGPNARPSHPGWFQSLRDQCIDAGVAFHFKQWGEWVAQPLVGKADGCFIGDRFTTEIPWNPGGHPEVCRCMARVGKKRAGRELDGRTWDQMPGDIR